MGGTIKTSVSAVEMNLIVNKKIDVSTRLRHLLEELNELFSGTFKSDWEEKTVLDWHEWGKFPYMQ